MLILRGYTMRQRLRIMATLALLGAGLLLLSACEGVRFGGGDGLSLHLTPREAQVCRDNVHNALVQRNVTKDWVQRIQYHAVRRNTRGARGRVSGFQAWVHPRSGGGVLVVELTEFCIVRQVWARGAR